MHAPSQQIQTGSWHLQSWLQVSTCYYRQVMPAFVLSRLYGASPVDGHYTPIYAYAIYHAVTKLGTLAPPTDDHVNGTNKWWRIHPQVSRNENHLLFYQRYSAVPQHIYLVLNQQVYMKWLLSFFSDVVSCQRGFVEQIFQFMYWPCLQISKSQK